MAGIVFREASPADAAFLARAMQEADRGHTGIGSWDIVFPGSEDSRLRALAKLAAARSPSLVHWSKFRLAEVDGRIQAATAGCGPNETTPPAPLSLQAAAKVQKPIRAQHVTAGQKPP